MNLQPDLQRQWFVYFQEKEQGPLSENEVIQKLTNGELDPSAYLFTEGMTDWTLLSDLPHLKTQIQPKTPQQSVAPRGPSFQSQSGIKINPTQSIHSGSQNSGMANVSSGIQPRPASEPTLNPAAAGVRTQNTNSGVVIHSEQISKNAQQPTAAMPSALGAQSAAKPQSAAKQTYFSVSRPLRLLAILVVLAGAFAYYWQDQQNAMMQEAAIDETPITAVGSDAAAVAPVAAQSPAVSDNVDWEELLAVRNSQDPQAKAFRIASKSLGGTRPIIVGSLSAKIQTSSIDVIVFPDNEKNLLPVPAVWTFKVPVIDGFFTVGPLNVAGEELPVGTYYLMAAYQKRFLGEVSFTHGEWPEAIRLSPLKQKIIEERALFAQKERGLLEQRFQEYSKLSSELQSAFQASLGKGLASWKLFYPQWTTQVTERLQSQVQVLEGPMFYPVVQFKVFEGIQKLNRMAVQANQAALGGLRGTKDRASLKTTFAAAKTEADALLTEIKNLAQSPVQELKVDRDVLRRQLTGESAETATNTNPSVATPNQTKEGL